jgi:hypothetical protein
MYHPFFRGKQFELITVRETATLLAKSKFVPIIEPVKEGLSTLEKTLKTLCEAGGNAVIIVNPSYGVHSDDGQSISLFLKAQFHDNPLVDVGVLLKENMTLNDALACYNEHQNHTITFVHAGFTEAKALADSLGDHLTETRHVFFEDHCGKLYRKHFAAVYHFLPSSKEWFPATPYREALAWRGGGRCFENAPHCRWARTPRAIRRTSRGPSSARFTNG